MDAYTRDVAEAMRPLDVEVIGVHRSQDPSSVVDSADAIFVGGGNAFRLLTQMYRHELIDTVRSAVRHGAVYVGSSAGTNLACPTLRTTNDMPIVQPPTLDALGLVPFQINPHYPAAEVMGGHLGESRDERITEFLEENDVPVLGLQEGSWLRVEDHTARVEGVTGGRLFRRGESATDIGPGTDVSHLLSIEAHYDSPSPAG